MLDAKYFEVCLIRILPYCGLSQALSRKTLEEVARMIRNNSQPFGGIQLGT